MKIWFIIFGILILSINVSFSQVTKVLFLGNSYTAANNLPEKVSKLASSLGDSVYYDSNTPGGYRLMNHVTSPTTLAKISQENWDYVVIQAQSQEPSWPPSQVASEVFPYASILNDSIKSNDFCSETVFYMTWGRKYGDTQNCPTWPPVCTFLGMQERLMAGYMTMAEENSSTVAPVGLAWKHSMNNDPDSLINLYSGDNSHPSLSGTYLTACVMYATMFQKSPIGANYTAGLTEYDAIFLQQIAEVVVLSETYNFTFYDNYTNTNYDLGWQSWFDLGNIAFADFSVVGMGSTYNFVDNSLNAQNYLWEFGDGNSSSVQNPSHTYLESGEYIITQTINNTCFEDEINDTINLVISSNSDIKEKDIVIIYPNPGGGIYNLEIDSQAKFDHISYQVFSTNGELVFENVVQSSNRKLLNQINLSTVNEGLYYLLIKLNDETIIKTLIVQ